MKKDLYSVIKSPYLTEKVSALMGESNQYAFKVDINATKLQIKKAVESYFSVNVEDVNVIKIKGKAKRSRYRIKKRSDWKKAYVRLAEGQTIEVSSE
ncbi:MAG: 50S ribosomal protein L23 [Gammaproteobacteria bacterium]|jgi:large subunit ribosomal protein L23|nr:50S ribosomal protein L23 [Gammaproteobacteria bacterium]HJL95427.1 50S ribosomal protein L23 [SAR86 cluster bacterium]HJM59728.1 50S ribosomal protein L23 [SAR86 cluster bacterium]|tara:strand:+ start:18578 stop:18868 length:291 start_codon:yes stop_codon:yes gene_type:complete